MIGSGPCEELENEMRGETVWGKRGASAGSYREATAREKRSRAWQLRVDEPFLRSMSASGVPVTSRAVLIFGNAVSSPPRSFR